MELNEKAILKQQYIAFFVALILFLPSLFLSATLLGVAKSWLFQGVSKSWVK